MNKTKILKALTNVFVSSQVKESKEYKDISSIKSNIRKREATDVDSLIYYYTELLQLYYLSAKGQLNWIYSNILKDAVKEILNIKELNKIDFYAIDELKQWQAWDIL
jgi:hypothetical protein